MVFCAIAWRQFGLATSKLALGQATTAGEREAIKQRRRLFNIAVMVSVSLLVMMGALLSTSLKLEEWSRTADISLTCAIKETPTSRNWEAYGFHEGNIVEACSAELANEIQFVLPCASGCFWHSTITTNSLTCENVKGWTFEEHLDDKAFDREQGIINEKFDPCDCPCSSLIEIERPRFDIFVGLSMIV
jgi:hypothetical protein